MIEEGDGKKDGAKLLSDDDAPKHQKRKLAEERAKRGGLRPPPGRPTLYSPRVFVPCVFPVQHIFPSSGSCTSSSRCAYC